MRPTPHVTTRGWRRLRFLRAAAGRCFPRTCARDSIVAIDTLAPLVTLLRFDRQRRDGPRFQPPQRDRLAGLLAIAVGAVFEPLQGSIDLGDQLALPVARPQFDRPVGLRGGAIGKVWMILILVLQMLQRLLRLLENILFPLQELVTKILALALVH